MSAPYADAAETYRQRGWAPLPLQPGTKSPPPAGWTGYGAPVPSGADVAEWSANGHGRGNVALRMPETVVGLDVDAYNGKPGAATLAESESEARLGPLPATPISTSRDDGISGIRFFRVPAGRCWADVVGPGIEVVHHGHRYAVAAPSVHPEGRPYRWLDADGRQVPGPAVDDLPELPSRWVVELDHGAGADRVIKAELTDTATAKLVAAMPAGEPCPYVSRVLEDAQAELGTAASRHDTVNKFVGRLVRAGEQGHHGVVVALDTLEGAFRAAVAADPARPHDPHEWRRSVAGAVALVRASPTGEADRGCCGPVELVPSNPPTDDQSASLSDGAREMVLTAASAIKPRRVQWAWTARLALGTLALLAGPEGLGKSTLAYWIAARITRGELPGEYHGTPRGVLVCATEDSWEHTIVPRLIAAGADLERVFRVEVRLAHDIHVGLSLPRDLVAVDRAAGQVDAALLILDPLMSRLDASLDTHRDGEVRRALEPLASLADRASLAVLGLIHHNKSGSTDPLQVVMASKAFTAVARSVHSVIRDPDDDTDMRRLFGTPKNNLGRTDQPTLAFTIASYAVETDDGPAWTGRVEWAGEVVGTIRDAMSRTHDDGDRTATAEAGDWLADYLTSCGGEASSADVKKAGHAAGHSADCLKRAKRRLGIGDRSEGFPRRTMWNLPDSAVGAPDAPTVGAPVGAQSAQETRGDAPTALTNSQSAPTVQVSAQSAQSEQSERPRETGAPTVLPLSRTTDTTTWDELWREADARDNLDAATDTTCPDCARNLDTEPASTCGCPDLHGSGVNP